MTVLSIIGVIVFFIVLYYVLERINIYTLNIYNYEFFKVESFFLYFIIYGLFYFGWDWYSDALKVNGDILNGLILMIIGFILFILNLIINIKESSFFMGLLFTLLQTVLYIPIATLGFFILLVAMTFASQVRPVYSLNSK